LARLALHGEREAPVHRADAAFCDHIAWVAGIDLTAGVARLLGDRVEQVCDLVGRPGHAVEVAHSDMVCVWCVVMSTAW
jgi:hypothetical protein